MTTRQQQQRARRATIAVVSRYGSKNLRAMPASASAGCGNGAG